jgi:hypothetical protein
MKKYIYSPHHQGLVLAPLMVKPDKSNGIFWDEYKPETGEWDFNKDMFNAHMGHYNTWLSSPPAFKVRPEDIEWFSVERGEDEFEVKELWNPISVDGVTNSGTIYQPLDYAIPKKGNESKEQVDSPIDLQQSKRGLTSGDWYLNERGNRITVLYVVDGWCMVRDGDKKPFVVPEEFVLGTFDKSTAQ